MSTSGIPFSNQSTVSQPVAGQLASDLRAACSSMGRDEWRALLLHSITGAAVTTGRLRGRALLRMGQTVVGAVGHVISVGPRQAAADACDSLKGQVAGLPGRARTAWQQFVSLTRARQIDEVVQALLTWMLFYASAGGADLEGGLPDTDLMLGIGNHRNVLSHSVLLGMESEIGMRFALEMLGGLIGRMPANRHAVWGGIHDFLARTTDSAVTGIWLGIGAHLLKDAGLLHIGHTKPVNGLPIPMSMASHQAFLAANGVASVTVAGERSQAPGGQVARRPTRP